MRHFEPYGELYFTVSGWLDHWTNGGTGLTKFDVKDRPIYEVAIKESGRTDLFLKGNELHSETHDNKSDFWEVYRRLKAEAAAPSPQNQREGAQTPANATCYRCRKREYADRAGDSFQVNDCDRCEQPVCENCADSDYDLQGDPPRYVCTQWVCKGRCK